MEGISIESRVRVFGINYQSDRLVDVDVDNRQTHQFNNNNENMKFIEIKEINSIKLEEVVSRAD
jgi:hypothetical protein